MIETTDVSSAGGGPGPCPACGALHLRLVWDGFDTNWFCEACGACWFYSMGWFGRVDPGTCPGCSETQLRECQARALLREETGASTQSRS
jgi:hypothetical protein